MRRCVLCARSLARSLARPTDRPTDRPRSTHDVIETTGYRRDTEAKLKAHHDERSSGRKESRSSMMSGMMKPKQSLDEVRTMQWTAMQCNGLQCSAVQCSAMQCTAVHCSAMHCSWNDHGMQRYAGHDERPSRRPTSPSHVTSIHPYIHIQSIAPRGKGGRPTEPHERGVV